MDKKIFCAAKLQKNNDIHKCVCHFLQILLHFAASAEKGNHQLAITNHQSPITNHQLPIVGLVVGLSTNVPEVRTHGLFATGRVLLRREVDLVRSDLVEIVLTSLHSSSHSGEASASIQLIGRQRGATLHFVAQVEAVAGIALRCRYAVGGEQHLRTRMLAALAGFAQCAGDTVDTG